MRPHLGWNTRFDKSTCCFTELLKRVVDTVSTSALLALLLNIQFGSATILHDFSDLLELLANSDGQSCTCTVLRTLKQRFQFTSISELIGLIASQKNHDSSGLLCKMILWVQLNINNQTIDPLKFLPVTLFYRSSVTSYSLTVTLFNNTLKEPLKVNFFHE